MKSFFKDFKEFISKGNVIDMAVGVVIGGAFGKIVTGLVNFIINPFIGLLTGGTSLDGLKTVIKAAEPAVDGKEAVEEVAILWGSWIQTIVDFLIVAFCIFLVLRVIMRMQHRLEDLKKKAFEKEEAAPAAPTTKICPFCKSEIAIDATRCPHCTSELTE